MPGGRTPERAVNPLDDAFTRITCGTILINKANLCRPARQPVAGIPPAHFDVAVASDRANRVTAFAYLASAMSLAESATECDVPEWSTPIAELLHEWKPIYSGLRLVLRNDLALDSVRNR